MNRRMLQVIVRGVGGLLIACLALLVVEITAVPVLAAARKPSTTYTMRIACFTATPKSPKLARSKADFAAIIKQAPILPESGAPSVLDISTPTRFRKQMESVSGSYDYAWVAGGSVSCDSGSMCPIDIPSSTDDLSKAQLKGTWSLTVKDPTTVKLDIQELTLRLILPGYTGLQPFLSVKTARTVALNRTYMLPGIAKQQSGKTALWIFAVCIVPGR
jgi:hypothetical protein